MCPIYQPTDYPDLRAQDHARNSKAISWGAYHRVLECLFDTPENSLFNGFRFVRCVVFGGSSFFA